MVSKYSFLLLYNMWKGYVKLTVVCWLLHRCAEERRGGGEGGGINAFGQSEALLPSPNFGAAQTGPEHESDFGFPTVKSSVLIDKHTFPYIDCVLFICFYIQAYFYVQAGRFWCSRGPLMLVAKKRPDASRPMSGEDSNKVCPHQTQPKFPLFSHRPVSHTHIWSVFI